MADRIPVTALHAAYADRLTQLDCDAADGVEE